MSDLTEKKLPIFEPDSIIPGQYWSEVLAKSELLVRIQYGTGSDSFVSYFHFAEQKLFLCQTGVTMVSGPLLVTLFARTKAQFRKEIDQPNVLQTRLKRFAVETALQYYRERMN